MWSWVHSFGSQGRSFHTRIHGHYWSNYVTHLVPIISCGEGKAFPLTCTSNSTSNTVWINVKFPSSCQLIITSLLQWLPLCRSRVWICKSLAGTTTSKLSRGLLIGGGTWILDGWDCTGSLQRWLEEPVQLGRWRRPRQCEDHTNVDKSFVIISTLHIQSMQWLLIRAKLSIYRFLHILLWPVLSR